MAIMHVALNLTETIKEVVRALSFQNNEKSLETIEQLEIPSDMLVFGDPVRLHQVRSWSKFSNVHIAIFPAPRPVMFIVMGNIYDFCFGGVA